MCIVYVCALCVCVQVRVYVVYVRVRPCVHVYMHTMPGAGDGSFSTQLPGVIWNNPWRSQTSHCMDKVLTCHISVGDWEPNPHGGADRAGAESAGRPGDRGGPPRSREERGRLLPADCPVQADRLLVAVALARPSA